MTADRWARAVEGSRLADACRRVSRARRRAARNARVTEECRGLDAWVQRAVAGSVLVAWLTAEPEPEMIVIDLRDTWTVGPILTALDALTARIPEEVGDSFGGLWRRATAAPMRLLGVALLAIGARLVAADLVAAGSVLLVAGALSFVESRPWSELRETVTGRVLRAVFTPPDETTRR